MLLKRERERERERKSGQFFICSHSAGRAVQEGKEERETEQEQTIKRFKALRVNALHCNTFVSSAFAPLLSFDFENVSFSF
jgi:hypothetical protein